MRKRKILFWMGLVVVLGSGVLFAEGITRVFGPKYCFHFDPWNHHEQLLRYQNFCDSFHYYNSEFKYGRRVNDIGFTDHRILSDIDISCGVRILALGDSFTEGVGVSYKYSWPQRLEQKLNTVSHNHITVYNAGVGGADPFFEYKNLKYLMPLIRPDIIIVMMNPSDYEEAYYRLGWERFKGDREVVFVRNPPWWKDYYKKVALVRLLIHSLGFNCFLTKETFDTSVYGQMLLSSAIDSMKSIAESHQSVFVPVFHPIPSNEKCNQCWGGQDIFTQTCNSNFLDLTPIVKECPGKECFWPIDRHCKARGYFLFSEKIFEHLNQIIPDLSR